MSLITTDFMFRNSDLVFGSTVAALAAGEVFSLGKYVGENTEAIQESVEPLVQAFTRQEGEQDDVFHGRLIKNAGMTAAVTLGTGAVIDKTISIIKNTPALSNNLSLTIPAIIGTLCLIAEAFFYGSSHIETLKAELPKLASKVQDAFTQREGESDEAAFGRITTNVIYTTVGLTALGIACAGAASLSSAVINIIVHGGKLEKLLELGTILPGSSTALGMLGWYGAVAGSHMALAKTSFDQQDAKGMIYHSTAAFLAMAFPIQSLSTSSAIGLTSSFTGLALMLAPSDSIKTFGSMITLNAGANLFFKQVTSWVSYYTGETYYTHKAFDFLHVVFKNFSATVSTVAALTGIEYMRKRILPHNKKENPKVAPLETRDIQTAPSSQLKGGASEAEVPVSPKIETAPSPKVEEEIIVPTEKSSTWSTATKLLGASAALTALGGLYYAHQAEMLKLTSFDTLSAYLKPEKIQLPILENIPSVNDAAAGLPQSIAGESFQNDLVNQDTASFWDRQFIKGVLAGGIVPVGELIRKSLQSSQQVKDLATLVQVLVDLDTLRHPIRGVPLAGMASHR